MVPISGYYLGTTPSTPINSAPFARPQSMSQATLPRDSHAAKAANRASMPPPSRTPTSPTLPTSPTSHETQSRTAPQTFEPTPEEPGEEDEEDLAQAARPPKSNRRSRHGTMDREFKFPPPSPAPTDAPKGALTSTSEQPASTGDTQPPGYTVDDDGVEEAGLTAVGTVAPSVEVPPPPPVEKEVSGISEEGEEDVGETEEISLN